MKGSVEGRFLHCTALSRHILPFVMLPPALIVLPLKLEENHFKVVTGEVLNEKGFREIAKWMKKVEKIWEEKRNEKAENQTIYEWLDYQGKLSSQDLSSQYLVLYNAAGTNLCATSINRRDYPLHFIVDHKLYWASCSSPEEADYLTAILNSDAINEAIKPFQSLGLMGERDIHKKVLDLPFPEYNVKMQRHRDLCSLAAQARKKAAEYISSMTLPASLGKRRGMIRQHLSGILTEIDRLVLQLL